MNRNCQGHLESTQSRKDEGPYLSVEAFIVSVITPGVTVGGRVSFNVFATYWTPQSDGRDEITALPAYRGTKFFIGVHLQPSL